MRYRAILLVALSTFGLGGCRVLAPVPIPNEKQNFSSALIDTDMPQIEVGRKALLLDKVGWVIGIPGKITLWDHRVDRHKISEPTLGMMEHYLEVNNLPHVKVRANQYAPHRDFKRLAKNKTMSWFTRYTIGLLSVGQEALIPGRLFGGDHFNPYTQTIHLYSDIPAIAIHEGGHAKDFTRREYQDLYALAYGLLPLWHETIATEDAFAYMETFGTPGDIKEANRILYPAYGTYVGGALSGMIPEQSSPIFYGAVIAGHLNGRLLARQNNGSVGIVSPSIVSASPETTSLTSQEKDLQDVDAIEQVNYMSGPEAESGFVLSDEFLLGQPSTSP